MIEYVSTPSVGRPFGRLTRGVNYHRSFFTRDSRISIVIHLRAALTGRVKRKINPNEDVDLQSAASGNRDWPVAPGASKLLPVRYAISHARHRKAFHQLSIDLIRDIHCGARYARTVSIAIQFGEAGDRARALQAPAISVLLRGCIGILSGK